MDSKGEAPFDLRLALTAVLRIAIEVSQAEWGGIRSESGIAVPDRRGWKRIVVEHGKAPHSPPCDRAAEQIWVTRRYPLRYQEKLLAVLHLGVRAEGWSDLADRCLRVLVETAPYRIVRCQIGSEAFRRFGIDLGWIESGHSMLALDRFIESAGSSLCPVLLTGERGSCLGRFAVSLHLASPNSRKPLVHQHCRWSDRKRQRQDLATACRAARGGTLFLVRIEDLSDNARRSAFQFLRRRLQEPRGPEFRLIVSARDGALALHFCTEICPTEQWRTFELPPLRERPESISAHLRTMADRLKIDLAESTVRAFQGYSWPGNFRELEAALVRLEACRGIRRFDGISGQALPVGPECSLGEILDRAACSLKPGQRRALEAAKRVLNKDSFDQDGIHPTVKKALQHIGSNFQDELTLQALSQACCVSRWHLSRLFQQSLGVTFKSLLIATRIIEACMLLATSNMSVTGVWQQTGFGDLRQFERQFKSWIGQSPSKFRIRLQKAFPR